MSLRCSLKSYRSHVGRAPASALGVLLLMAFAHTAVAQPAKKAQGTGIEGSWSGGEPSLSRPARESRPDVARITVARAADMR